MRHSAILAALFPFMFASEASALDARPVLPAQGYAAVVSALFEGTPVSGERLAAAGFYYSDNRDSLDGGAVAEKLAGEIAKKMKVTRVERGEAETAVRELNLERAGLRNPAKLKALAGTLGADFIVTGTLDPVDANTLHLSARLVNAATGTTLKTVNGRVPKDWQGKYKAAVREETKSITRDPKVEGPFYRRGLAYLDLLDFRKAAANFSLSIAIRPTYWEAYLGRAEAYAQSGKYDQAIEDYTIAIQLTANPERAPAFLYSQRGAAYVQNEDYKRALADMTIAVELDPADPYNYLARGICHFKSKDYDSAVRDLTTAIGIDSFDPVYYYHRGEAYRLSGADESAISDYARAVELSPAYALPYTGRGLVYVGKDDIHNALEYLTRGIELGRSAYAYSCRGLVYSMKMGMPKRAIEDFNKAVQLAPKDARNYANRGFAHGAAGDRKSAAKDFNKAIALDPKLAPQLQPFLNSLKSK